MHCDACGAYGVYEAANRRSTYGTVDVGVAMEWTGCIGAGESTQSLRLRVSYGFIEFVSGTFCGESVTEKSK